MKTIKVLGTGGPRCIEMYNTVKSAINESKVDVILEKVTTYEEIYKFGFVTTPAMVIEGTIKVMNRVPTKDEVLAWINE